MKSGWPGVSIRLTVTSPIANDATADLIVIPRCRSSSSESLRCAVVDAADRVDHAGHVEQPLGECRLTGVSCARIPRFSVLRSKRHSLRIGHKGLLVAMNAWRMSPPGSIGAVNFLS